MTEEIVVSRAGICAHIYTYPSPHTCMDTNWFSAWSMDFNNGAMVIVAGCGHDDTSSNPGPDWLHFT